MITVYLIRHGQKQSSLPDPELTELGHAQAKKTGAFLATKKISKIVASPLIRTRQTAGHIAQTLGLTIQTDPRLKERMDYQAGDDSSLNTGKRIKQVIENLDDANNHTIAVVTHGGAIADFLKYSFDMDVLRKQVGDITIETDLNIQECSITKVIKNGNEYLLEEYHYTQHLD